MKNDFYPVLTANNFYHIYNRGNNRENIFHKPENYFYFLRKYDTYLSPFLETYAYCLLPNHFHLLVRVRKETEVLLAAKALNFTKQGKPITDVDVIISEAFRRFFMAYAKAINKQSGRTGSLFQKNFKRKLVDNEAYFTTLVRYIHINPPLHGICDDYGTYLYSSYHRILIDNPSKLYKKEVLAWFNGKNGYVQFHNTKWADVTNSECYEIEDY